MPELDVGSSERTLEGSREDAFVISKGVPVTGHAVDAGSGEGVISVVVDSGVSEA